MFAPIIQLSFDGGNTKENVNWEENKFAHFINNITFGLVTAVVVQEVSEENAEKHLYNRFQPIYKEYLTGLERKIRSEKNRSEARGKLRQAWFTLRKFPMKAVLFSAHYYTYYWIITGFVTLVYAISLDLFGKDLQASNPLYSSGQTWAGVATTIAYTHFGLSGKDAPKHDDAKDAIDRTGGGDGANGGEEANFTDESGETNVVKAASVEELELQVKEAEEEMRAAADRQDYVTAVKLQNDIMELNKKIEDEKDAVASRDATDIMII